MLLVFFTVLTGRASSLQNLPASVIPPKLWYKKPDPNCHNQSRSLAAGKKTGEQPVSILGKRIRCTEKGRRQWLSSSDRPCTVSLDRRPLDSTHESQQSIPAMKDAQRQQTMNSETFTYNHVINNTMFYINLVKSDQQSPSFSSTNQQLHWYVSLFQLFPNTQRYCWLKSLKAMES